MPLILGAPTGDIYDSRQLSPDALGALIVDRRVTNPSFDAGARLIPTGTYRLGEQLRRDREPAPLDPLLTEIFQVLLREKYKVVSAMQRVYPEVHPIINMHGVDTSPYRGPHASVSQATRYHEDMIAKCLSSTFPHRHIPLLYELIPTLEEACVIAHLCKQYCWKVVISLYIKRNPEGKICIQNTDGRLIPVVRALRQVEEVADISRAWYAFNCFDPRLTEGLIQTLKSSGLWHRVRGVYPNLADVENDPNYMPVWDETTESHLVGWNPPDENMPSFIGACCGSTPEHIRRLRSRLG